MRLVNSLDSIVQTTDQVVTDYSRPTVNLLPANIANACESGTNPGFNAFASGGATGAIDTTDAYRGSNSYKATSTAAASQTVAAYLPYTALPAVVAGKQYTFQSRVKVVSAAAKTSRVIFSWKDASGNATGQSDGELITTDGTWQLVSVTATAPANTTGVMLTSQAYGMLQNEVIKIDALMLNEGDLVAWEMPPNHAQSGSTSAIDTNDPQWTPYGRQYGPDDYDLIPYAPELQSTDEFTVMVVCKPNSLGGNLLGRVFEITGCMSIMTCFVTSNIIRFSDGTINIDGSNSLVLGDYNLIEVKFKKSLPTNQVKIRTNGSETVGTKTTSLNTVTAPIYIGNRAALDRYFDGTICAVLYWPNKYLTDCESVQARRWLKVEMAKRGVILNV
jgi:hypothetical protein